MKSIYFNEREKRLYNSFSKKNDYYKDCYLGESEVLKVGIFLLNNL
jgi:hypothetical protein